MKKTSFFLAAALILLTASCNRQQPLPGGQSGPRNEIQFHPTCSFESKSSINGTVFPSGCDLLVSAYRNVGSVSGADFSQNYFEGIPFGHDAVSGAWKSEKGAKYFPSDGTLDFLAVACAGLNNAATGIVPSAVWGESGNVAKKVVLTVPANDTPFDDLLFGAANAWEVIANNVSLELQHAMTSVVFLARCNVAYNAATNSGITIDGITLDGARYSGTLTVNNPSAGEGAGSLSASWSDLGDVRAHVAARVWNPANLGTHVAESALSGLNLTHTVATLEAKPFGEGYVLLPPQGAVPFTITYTIHNGYASDGVTPLNKQVQFCHTPSGNWEMGKKNVYALDFSLPEILVHASIEDWRTVEEEIVSIPNPYNGHACVDLGLRRNGYKVLFATMNIGASSPEQSGDFFAWGEPAKHYTRISGTSIEGGAFEWASTPYHTTSPVSPFNRFTKYTGDMDIYAPNGVAPDGLLTLDPEDDAATMLWGGRWRMPDMDELALLINKRYDKVGDGLVDISPSVNYEWITDYEGTGVNGLLVRGQGAFSAASLFLPETGYCVGNLYNLEFTGIHCWTRELAWNDGECGRSLEISRYEVAPYEYEEDIVIGNTRRCGLPIRPVLLLRE